MAARTAVNNGTAEAHAADDEHGSLAGGMGRIAQDLLELIELQTRLLLVEMRDARRVWMRAACIGLISMAIFLGSVSIGLHGVVELLVRDAEWSPAAAYLSVAAGSLVIAACVLYVALRKVRATQSAFASSQEELTRNLEWLRSLLKTR